jgi:hypothetical protein
VLQHAIANGKIETAVNLRNALSSGCMDRGVKIPAACFCSFPRIRIDANQITPPDAADQDLGQPTVSAADIDPDANRDSQLDESRDFDRPKKGCGWLEGVDAKKVPQKFQIHLKASTLTPDSACPDSKLSAFSLVSAAPAGAFSPYCMLLPNIPEPDVARLWELGDGPGNRLCEYAS